MVKALCALWVDGVAHTLHRVVLFNFSISAIPAIPIMVFAYHCHVQAVPIYYELTDDPKLFTIITAAWARCGGAPRTGRSAGRYRL